MKQLLVCVLVACCMAGTLHAEGAAETIATKIGTVAQKLENGAREKLMENAAALLLLEREERVFLRANGKGENAKYFPVLNGDTGGDDAKAALVSASAPADEIVFDGQRLRGGNFGYVDGMIGKGGLPIGMDRQLPMMIVPVSSEVADTLAKVGDEFRRTKEAEMTLARINRLHTVDVSTAVVDDGIILRPYTGRFDDWYFRLAQQGDAVTTLQFYGILDALPERCYHPVLGVGKPESVPPLWFSISDIFSEGASDAIRRYRAERNGIGRNPFAGYAARLMPFVADQLRSLRHGSALQISAGAITGAYRNRRRFVPPVVVPIVKDPSRFTGCLAPDWIFAANVPEMRTEVESALELPERSGAPESNEILTNPEAIRVWESPNSETPAVSFVPAPSGGSLKVPSPATAPEQQAPIVARAAFAKTQVIVLTPTIDEAERFVQKIAESDQQLAANARTLNRVTAKMRWLTQAHEQLKAAADTEGVNAEIERAIGELRAAFDDLIAIRDRSLDLRQQIREAAVDQVRSDRYRKFQELSAAPAAL